jgi:exopolysaccharide biosynthesis predicted pyruvyltransferase EpsI
VRRVGELLADYAGARVFFGRVPGNNGDVLIELGSREAMQRAGLELVDSPNTADVIAMNGGAWISDLYPEAYSRLVNLGRKYPNTPLVVFPNTITLSRVDALNEWLADRSAPTTFFAREDISYQSLRQAGLGPNVEVAMDHDMAFNLIGTTWLTEQQGLATVRHGLVVERTDLERTSQASLGEPVLPLWVRRFYPPWLLEPIRRLKASRHRRSAVNTEFARCAATVFACAGAEGLPVVAADISDPQVCHFDDFVAIVAAAAIVATNRLHVGILSTMLGKPTYFWPAVNFKIARVFECSLRRYSNAKLMSD